MHLLGSERPRVNSARQCPVYLESCWQSQEVITSSLRINLLPAGSWLGSEQNIETPIKLPHSSGEKQGPLGFEVVSGLRSFLE